MIKSRLVYATVGALALAGVATLPAEARGLGPAIAGAAIGGAIIAGAASSAYAYAPGPAYVDPGYGYGAYDAYDGPGYYAPAYGRHYGRNAYGTYDESQHGGQPSYSRPY